LNDIMSAITNVIYTQGVSVSSFVSMSELSMFLHAPFPSSATDGNQAMISSILAKSGCVQRKCLHLNTTVDSITQVHTRDTDNTTDNNHNDNNHNNNHNNKHNDDNSDGRNRAADTGSSSRMNDGGSNGGGSSSGGGGGGVSYKLVVTHHHRTINDNDSGDRTTSAKRTTATTMTTTTEDFDAVVIATPLESSNITMLPPLVAPPEREYVSVHTTVVTGVINGSFFGVPLMRQGSLIMAPTESTVKAGVHFVWNRGNVTVLNTHGANQTTDERVAGDEGAEKDGEREVLSVYLLHSAELIDALQLASMFQKVHNVTRHLWPAAYPKEIAVAPKDLPPIEIAAGLYYTSSIESVASSMETSALSSRNIATLLAQKWK